MRIVLLAVGKVRERGVREAIDEYIRRIERYAHVEEIEIRDGDEGGVEERFAQAIPDRSHVVVLDVVGAAMASAAFAAFLGRVQEEGVTHLVFLIGGSHGLPESVTKKAKTRLQLSTMTLPHRLARLFLVEQLYRGFTILRGEPYSH